MENHSDGCSVVLTHRARIVIDHLLDAVLLFKGAIHDFFCITADS